MKVEWRELDADFEWCVIAKVIVGQIRRSHTDRTQYYATSTLKFAEKPHVRFTAGPFTKEEARQELVEYAGLWILALGGL